MLLRIGLTALVVLMAAPTVCAERQNTLSSEIAATAALDDNPRVGIGSIDIGLGQISPVYALFPTISLESLGANSSFDLSYGFGYQYIRETLVKDFYHHSFDTSFQAQATRNLGISISERFLKAPDFTTTNVFQGIVFTPEGVFFDYDTIVVEREGFANTISGDLDYRIGSRSALEFRLGHSMRRYDKIEIFSGRLSDHDRANGRFAYRNEISQRSSWDLSYDATFNRFKDFSNALTHQAGAGVSHQIGTSADLRFEVGPAYIQSEESSMDYWGYHLTVRISKTLEENYISLFFRHNPGVSTGIGSVSETDRVGFNFNRPLGRRTTVSAGLSFYDQKRKLDNPIDLRGYQVSARLQFLLFENLALAVGGDYRKQDEDTVQFQDSLFDYERRRVFVTLSFLFPQLARF